MSEALDGGSWSDQAVILRDGSAVFGFDRPSAASELHRVRVHVRAPEFVVTRDVTAHWNEGHSALIRYFRSLADGWRGWTGTLNYESIERDLQLEAAHDGQLRLHVTISDPWPGGWRADSYFDVEPGEELTRFADGLEKLVAQVQSN